MAINAYNGFYLTPSEIRQVIYSQTDDKSFFNMIPVCQLFYTDLTNEFFEKRCKALFLNNFVNSPFYDPFIKTIDCSWKAVLFCSINTDYVRLDHAAIMLAHMPLEKFKLYLSSTTIPPFQEKINSLQLKLEPICGRYYQDPDSEIHKAWERCKANWTEQDEMDLKESKEKTSLEYYDNLAATSTTEQIISFVMFEQKLHFDRRSILCEKKRNTHTEYNKIEDTRKSFQNNINANKAIINNYNKIINDPSHLKGYATSIFQVVIKGMADSIKWKPYLPALRELEHILLHQKKHAFLSNELTPEGAKKAHQLICSLPLEISTSIWENLYHLCANGAQEWQWSEKHFHEHVVELYGFTTNWIHTIEQRVSNKIDPTTNTTNLKSVLWDEFEEPPVGERPINSNPGECNLM